jgi:hypothetical protein
MTFKNALFLSGRRSNTIQGEDGIARALSLSCFSQGFWCFGVCDLIDGSYDKPIPPLAGILNVLLLRDKLSFVSC